MRYNKMCVPYKESYPFSYNKKDRFHDFSDKRSYRNGTFPIYGYRKNCKPKNIDINKDNIVLNEI